MDAYSSCCTRIFADEYHGRLLELLDSYSPTNTMDAYSSCWTPIRRRIPWTLIRVAGLLFADEYHGRLLELSGLLFAVAGIFADGYHGRLCWTPIRRRIPQMLIQLRADGYHGRLCRVAVS